MFSMFRRHARRAKHSPQVFRPRLTILEDRCLLSSPGSLDSTFGQGGIVTTALSSHAALMQPNGDIVAAGTTVVNNVNDFALARYTPTGSLDSTFGSAGTVTTSFGGTNATAWSAALYPSAGTANDGKTVAVGTVGSSIALARYNINGTLDSAFGSGGTVTTTLSNMASALGVAIQPDGKIVVGGYVKVTSTGDNAFLLLRYNANGSPDTTFGQGGQVITNPSAYDDEVNSVLILPSGDIVAGGYVSKVQYGYTWTYAALAEYTSSGVLDTTFGSGGLVTTAWSAGRSQASALALQGDGKIVAAGVASTSFPAPWQWGLARYNSSGSLDTTFGNLGIVLTSIGTGSAQGQHAWAVGLQNNGEMVVAGTSGLTSAPWAVATYTSSGALDTNFGGTGIVTTNLAGQPASVLIQPTDGKVIVGGASNIARYIGTITSTQASTFAITSSSSTVMAGTPLSITVTAQTADGSVATGYAGTVHFSSTDAQAGLPGDYTFTATDQGVHTFTVVLKTSGSQTITATDTSNGSLTGAVSFAIQAAGVSQLSITPSTANVASGAAFNFTVAALDPFGNVVTGYSGTVHFTSTDAQASLPADYPFVAADQGVHAFTATFHTAAAQTLTATGTILPGSAPDFTGLSDWWTGDNTTNDVVGGQTAALVGGASFGTGLVHQAFLLDGTTGYVNVSDSPALNVGSGNFSADFWVNFTSTDGEQVMMEKYIETLDSATEQGWTFTKLSSNAVRLAMASGGNVVNVDSGALDIPTGQWVHFALVRSAGQITTYMDGQAIASGTFTGDLSAACSLKLGHRGNPSDTPGSQDSRGFYLNGLMDEADLFVGHALSSADVEAIYQAGAAGKGKTWSGQASVTVTGTTTTASHLQATPAVTTTVAGVAFNVTVSVLDSAGNLATGYTGTVHFTSSSTKAVLPANYTFTSSDAGSHTFSIKLETAGNQSVTVTDAANAALTGQTSVTTEFTLPTPTGGPEGMAAGPDGNLWFTENSANQIGRSTPAGSITEFVLPAGSEPVSIVAGPDGNLWFTEEGTNRIGRLSPAGNLTEYTVPTAASEPYGIAVGSDGNLWFTELAGNKIGRITTAGIFKEFTLPAGSAPEGITSGPDKRLWFTESGTSKVAKMTTTGTITAYALAAGSSPAMIVTGSNKALWVTEPGTNSVAQVTTLGVVTTYTVPTSGGQPWAIAAGPDGALWFTELAGNLLGRITTKGALVEYPIASTSSQPWGIVAGPDSNVWWTEAASGKIGRLDPAIVVTPAAAKTFTLAGLASAVAGSPYTITVTAHDAYGNVATGYRGTIHFSSADVAAVLPADYTFTAADVGVHQFVGGVTFNTVGTQTLKATDTGTSTLTGKKTVTVTAAPAPLSPPAADWHFGLASTRDNATRWPMLDNGFDWIPDPSTVDWLMAEVLAPGKDVIA